MNEYEQECIPVGCVPPASMVMSTGGVYPGGWGSGGCLPRGVGVQEECLPIWGVHAPSWSIAMHAGIHTDPVNRMTDRCKNITFPQLRLWAIIKWKKTQFQYVEV